MTRDQLPLVTLSVVMTAGCAPDPVFGSWTGTSLTYNGAQIDLPDSERVEEEDFVVEDLFTYEMTVSQDAGPLLRRLETTRIDDELVYDNSADYVGSATRVVAGSWDLVFSDFGDLRLLCTATETLSCRGDFANNDTWAALFARVEE